MASTEFLFNALIFAFLTVGDCANSDNKSAQSESAEAGQKPLSSNAYLPQKGVPCSCSQAQEPQEQQQLGNSPSQQLPFQYPGYAAFFYQPQEEQEPSRSQRAQIFPIRFSPQQQRQTYPTQQYPSGLEPPQYPPYQPYPGAARPSNSRAGGARNLDVDNVQAYFGPTVSNQVQPPSQLSQGPGKDQKRPFLTPPTITFKIGIIADLGSEAKVEVGRFQSFLKEGTLSFAMESGKDGKYNVTVQFEDESHHVIESGLNNSDEGFELSTLNVFNGKLLSCDDETGIIYELVRKEQNETTPKNETYFAQPWVILTTEDEENTDFKCEWATVKNEHLWVGSTGILVRKTDEEVNMVDRTRQGVKVVAPSGQICHQDWALKYEKISDAIGIAAKGFAVHEAVAWSDRLEQWLFMPRRVSSEKYDKAAYHKKGGNAGIFVDDSFESEKVESFGNLTETSGFTSIKFIPGTDDQLILALKAGLDKDTNELVSTLEVFDLKGNQVMPETKVANGIYAGVEFI